jgi:hypothetical protein
MVYIMAMTNSTFYKTIGFRDLVERPPTAASAGKNQVFLN